MDYTQYKEHRNSMHNPQYDFGNLNLYNTYQTRIPERTTGHKGMNIHRCHLAEDFLRVYELDVPKENIALSQGVRQSLDTIAQKWSYRTWGIPQDQYPYYKETILKHNIAHEEYIADPRYHTDITSINADVLLICYPNKPYGYTLDDTKEQITQWLMADLNRHLVLDCVYLFDLHEEWLWQLFATGRTTILYSLSKAYSAPQRAGFTLTQDNSLREKFKKLPRWDLFDEAYVLLNDMPERKDRLRRQLIGRYYNAQAIFGATDLPPLDEKNPSYLYLIDKPWNKDSQKNIATIPLSIYNSKFSGTIISTL